MWATFLSTGGRNVRRAGKVVTWSLVICLPVIATTVRLWAAGQAAPTAPKAPSPESSPAPKVAPTAAIGSGNGATYVGAEACAQCHYDKFTSYQNSAHAMGGDPRTPAGRFGCESCHGGHPSMSRAAVGVAWVAS